jgi:hypothetical protein
MYLLALLMINKCTIVISNKQFVFLSNMILTNRGPLHGPFVQTRPTFTRAHITNPNNHAILPFLLNNYFQQPHAAALTTVVTPTQTLDLSIPLPWELTIPQSNPHKLKARAGNLRRMIWCGLSSQVMPDSSTSVPISHVYLASYLQGVPDHFLFLFVPFIS